MPFPGPALRGVSDQSITQPPSTARVGSRMGRAPTVRSTVPGGWGACSR